MQPSDIHHSDLLHHALMQSFNSVVITDLEQNIVYANPSFCRQTGYAIDELIGQNPRILQGPKTDPAVIQHLRECLSEKKYFEGTTVNYRKNGEAYYVRWNITPFSTNNGDITHYVSVQTERTEYLQVEQFNQKLLSSLGDGIFGLDATGKVTFINQAAITQLGYSQAEAIVGKSFHALAHYKNADGSFRDEQDCPIHKLLSTGQSLNMWRDVFFKADDSPVNLSVTAQPLFNLNDEIYGAIITTRDVSTLVASEHALTKQANLDNLTGAYNRHFFDDYMVEQNAADISNKIFTFILFDIDHFKHVNDDYGHHIGDEILVEFCVILKQQIRSSDILIRWGGEEFLLLLPDVPSEQGQNKAESLRRAIAKSQLSTHSLAITVSCGVVEHSIGEDIDETLKRADTALYRAKSEGRNKVCITSR